MQTTLIETKQALSEGGLSDHVRSDHEAKNDAISDDERLRNNGAAMLDQTSDDIGLGRDDSGEKNQKAVTRIKPIEVLKILGEGSQGVVALCRHRDVEVEQDTLENLTLQRRSSQQATSLELPRRRDTNTSLNAVPHHEDAFVIKIFNHWLETEEEHEVREVRLGNIQNENEVMVRKVMPLIGLILVHEILTRHV